MHSPTAPIANRPQRALCLFLALPQSPAKSAQMLALRHLAERGWQPTVLTLTTTSPGQIVEESWQGLRVMRLSPASQSWRRAVAVADRVRARSRNGLARWAWRLLSVSLSGSNHFGHATEELVQVADQLHSASPFAAVVSLYHPITSHIVAARLAHSWQVPWIATAKDFYSWPDQHVDNRLRRLLNRRRRRREAGLLAQASKILTVNDQLSDYIAGLVPQQTVATWPHCFDERSQCPADAGPPQASCSQPYRLVSVGLVDRADEPGLELLFSSVADILSDGQLPPDAVRFRFVGHGADVVQRVAARCGVEHQLELVAPVPHAEAVQEMRQADCLLFQQVAWGSRRRLADYFGARRPILAWPEFPSQRATTSQPLLERYGAVHLASSAASLKHTLLELVRKGRTHSPVIDDSLVEEFSSSSRGRELAAHLDDTLRPTSGIPS